MISFSSVIPKQLLSSSRSTKRLITNFAEDAGIVYFGYVSQRDDEHHIVRGLTVSTKHVDDHYCIGTYEDHDVVFVERRDSLKSNKKHTWHIIEFDLKAQVDLPHIFVSAAKPTHSFYDLLKTKYHTMQKLSLGALGTYPNEFTSHFNLYATPAHAITAEHILTPIIAATIASHFKGLSIEISEQALYVYSERAHLTTDLLQSMLVNGSWLAKQIDENSRLLT